jgi:hypothetical protein
MAEIDREKQERDKQIHLFIQKTLRDLLHRARRTSKRKKLKVNLDQPLVNMTPEERKYADEVMRIFREEDR